MAEKKSKKSEEKTESAPAPVTEAAVEQAPPVEAPDLSAKVDDLKQQNRALEANLDDVEKQLFAAQKKIDELNKQLSEALVHVPINKPEHEQRARLQYGGIEYEVLEVDTALEVIDKVRKSYVLQDAPVAVLKRA